MNLWTMHVPHLERLNRELGIGLDPKIVTWVTNCDDAAEPLTIVAFSNWTPWTCELTVWSTPKGVSRLFIRKCLEYPFVQAGRRRVNAIVSDTVVYGYLVRLGFTPEAVLKNWFGDKDGLMFRLLREDCAWLYAKERKSEQRLVASPA